MIRRMLILLGLVALAASWSLPANAAIATHDDLQRVCDEFYSLGLDSARAFDVKDATLVLDSATVRLTSGTLIFSAPVEGYAPIAVFLGKGAFTITPPRKMDREMLSIAMHDHLNKDVDGMINTPISRALIADFGDAFSKLKSSMKGPRAATPDELKDAGDLLKDRLAVMDVSGPALEFPLIGRILQDQQEEGFVHAELDTDDYGWMSLTWSPASTYEMSLRTREAVGAYYMVHTLVRTHKKADLDATGHYAADPVADSGDAIKVTHYNMDLDIPDLQQILANVAVTFEPLDDNLKLIWFSLTSDIYGPRWDSRAKWIDVESLTDKDGNELPNLHRKNRVIILPKTTPRKGEATTYTFNLRENTLIQLSNVHWLMLNTYPWFPQYGYLGGQYSFDWKIKTVKPLVAAGSGKILKTWEEAKENGVEMAFDRAVQFPSLIFGRYNEEKGTYDSTVSGKSVAFDVWSWPLTIFKFTDPTTCGLLRLNCPIDIELTVPPNKPGDVIKEGTTILKFLEDLYGPYPYDKMDVAMMAPGLGFGQSPPAFVQLTGEAFMSSSEIANSKFGNADFFHEFFSHELAHQWWGHKVGWVDDEDVWLSESFAEYSAALYVGSYLGKTRYLQKLRRWKENAEIADPHGSIAWANNVSGVNGGEWRTGLIYNKGPYVVHMLRMQMGMDKWTAAMKALFADHGYTNITTRAVQQECEKQVGYNLDFFFDQWFRGTGIPIFDYDWNAKKESDGTWLVTINISQRDKKNFKQVLMPVYFYFKGQKEPMIRARPITTADHVYKLKLPEKPEKIVLDEDHDILGDMYAAEGKH